MKKRLLFELLILLLSMVVVTDKVEAVSATKTKYSNYIQILQLNHYSSITGVDGKYRTRVKALTYNGVDYPALCIDPDFNATDNYDCQPTSDAGLIYIFENYIENDSNILNGSTEENKKYAMIELALRMYTVWKGLAQTSASDNNTRLAINQFMVACSTKFNDNIDNPCPEEAFRYLYGADSSYAEDAYEIAIRAYQATTSTSSTSTSVTVDWDTANSNSKTSKFKITSTTTIPEKQFAVTCDECKSIDYTWNGTSGTVTVQNPDDCAEFTLKFYYTPAGVQVCTAVNGASSFQKLLTSFQGESGEEIDTTGDPAQTFKASGIDCDNPECCTLSPITPGYMDGDVNNCCYDDTTSEVHEYSLNDLFCYDKDMKVDHYWAKCKGEYYIDSDLTNYTGASDYCTIYCTERVYISIPSSITAISGLYFKLTTTLEGTKSPYVEGYKRCRTIIDYDKWHDDYVEIVKQEISYYNSFQYNAAYSKMYQDAIDASYVTSETMTYTCTAITRSNSNSCTYWYGCYKETGAYEKNADGTYKKDSSGNYIKVTQWVDNGCSAVDSSGTITSDSASSWTSETFTITYTKYPFTSNKTYPRPYYYVKLNDELENSSSKIHNTVTMEYSSMGYTSHRDWSAYEISDQISKVESSMAQYNGQSNKGLENSENTGTCSKCDCGTVYSGKTYWSCTRTHINAEGREENVPAVKASYDRTAGTYNSLYNNTISSAKSMEAKLNYCDNYLVGGSSYSKANAERDYEFTISFQGFQYTQVYLNEYGSKVQNSTTIEFSDDPGCTFYGPTNEIGDADGLISPQYSSEVYKNQIEYMKDFASGTLSWVSTAEGADSYKKFIDGNVYFADTKFTQDGKYHVICYWNEGTNTLYTLIPSGEVSSSSIDNYTKNNRQYTVYLTTMEGTYDTKWLLSGIGSNGKFDNYFKTHSKTCSDAQNVSTDGILHCGLKIKREIIETGSCTPSGNSKVVVSTSECDAPTSLPVSLNFKVADPSDLFTSCSSYKECSYAYNWFSTSEGQATMKEIESRGKSDATYSSSRVTYSFTLTPTDMKHIKNYNTEREEGDGGYSDFDLDCECPNEASSCDYTVGDTQACLRTESCTQCKSEFIRNLYSGIVVYDGTNHNVTSASGNLNNIRSNNHWAGV